VPLIAGKCIHEPRLWWNYKEHWVFCNVVKLKDIVTDVLTGRAGEAGLFSPWKTAKQPGNPVGLLPRTLSASVDRKIESRKI